MRLAALGRCLGAQAVGGDARRGRAPRNLAHLLRSRGAAQVLLGIKLNGLIGAGGIVGGGVRTFEGFAAGRDKVAIDLRRHNGDDRAHGGADYRASNADLGGKRNARRRSRGAGDDLGDGNIIEQALFGRDGHGLADGVVFVNAVVECGGSHDARARRIGVLGRHTGSSRCKSASFHAAIRVPTRCESYVTFNRYHQLIKGACCLWRNSLMLNWTYDCEVVYVMYPYMTFEDGTEVIHSDLITDGDVEKVIVHFERPTAEGFDSARCELPSCSWTDWEGHFTQSEKRAFEECLSK